MNSIPWTTEQILGLAPDALLARAAERLANPQEWLALGRGAGYVWGEYPNSSQPPYTVLAMLPDLVLSCDCGSRKLPCRHALSLALLLSREQEAFDRQDPPPWVMKRLQPGTDGRFSTPPPFGDGTAYDQRLLAVRDGMQRLERWLRDIVHRGLADLPSRPVTFWNEMATRLDEAHAYETAQDLRDLGRLPGKQAGWTEQVLRRLGRLYLLTQGFAGYPALPPETQADLRAAAGWFADPAYPGEDVVRDHWLVLGTAHQVVGRHNLRRTWLYGRKHRRFAHFDPQAPGSPRLPALFSGTQLDAVLRFRPGGWAQRAALETLQGIMVTGDGAPGLSSLRQARLTVGKALSVNPWLRRFPLVLRGVQAAPDGDSWVLRDGAGYLLPLPHPFLYGWHLQLLGGSADSALFGEWDGQRLLPLSLYQDGQWLALTVLRGQK
jgi:hypothetical protein